jgi:hypothetical protein
MELQLLLLLDVLQLGIAGAAGVGVAADVATAAECWHRMRVPACNTS